MMTFLQRLCSSSGFELIEHIDSILEDVVCIREDYGEVNSEDFDLLMIPVCMRVDVLEIPEKTAKFVSLIHNHVLRNFMMHFLKCDMCLDAYKSKYHYEVLLYSLRTANTSEEIIRMFRRSMSIYNEYMPYQMGTRWVYEWPYVVSLKQELAKFYRLTLPFLSHKYNAIAQIPRKKPRIGFLSRHMAGHSVGNVFAPIILGLSDEFDVYIYTFSSHLSDKILHTFMHKLVKYYEFSQRDESFESFIHLVQSSIEQDHLDVLVFIDIGADRGSYFTSFLRLAPVQIAWWGFHDSDCTETDYFVSSKLFADHQAFFGPKETLVQFDTLGFVPVDEVDMRVDESYCPFLAIPDRHYYVCVQNLLKVNAEFCDVLRSILEKDDKAVIILLKSCVPCSPYKHHTLEAHFASLGMANRLHFLTPMPRPQYLRLISVAHVLLDTQPFGGCLTSLDCMRLGKPIVAAAYHCCTKATITAGIYRAIGYTELIATSPTMYADIGVRLATQPAYRDACGKAICERFHAYFDNSINKARVVQEWNQFLRTLVHI